MIKRIEKVHGLGIFQNFTAPAELNDFQKFNVVYGNNGSGKTTLSNLFRTISPSDDTRPDTNSKFSFLFTDGSKADHENPKSHGRTLLVYDQSFVEANIDWDTSVKSILLVSEEKISERKEFDEKKKLLIDKEKELETISETINLGKEEIAKFLTSTAKQLKLNFQVIATSDSQYLNYNKTKLERLIATLDLGKLDENVLEDTLVDNLTKSATSQVKPKLTGMIDELNPALIEKEFLTLQSVLKEKVVASVIERLRSNPVISHWVEDGLKISKDFKSDNCEFCGQPLPKNRISEIEAHFNDALVKYKAQLQDLKHKITGFCPDLSKLPGETELYPELLDSYREKKAKLLTDCRTFTAFIQTALDAVSKKNDEPFAPLSFSDFNPTLVRVLNVSIQDVNSLLVAHNAKTDTFQASVSEDKRRLELHYSSAYIADFDYKNKIEKIKTITGMQASLSEEVEILQNRLLILEKDLSSETLGASKFNDRLQRFLGHSEISLSFSTDLGGYEIKRKGQEGLAKRLSEGEKNALAFIYFATKVRERGNDLNDCIVVIDDPVSSFDSKNIFHAFSFLRSEFSMTKQLFIFTHNFLFFKLVRDWILPKNEKKKNSINSIRSRCFIVEVDLQESRRSAIKNAPMALVDYGSEYHFIFLTLKKFQSMSSLNLEQTFLASNLSRKLLETFLSFKFPKKRGNFRELMEVAVSDKEVLERVYRFINTYSHFAPIGSSEASIESLVGETPEIISGVFKILESIDSVHYEEMKTIE